LNAEEAEQMRSAAESTGVVAFIGHEFRFGTENALIARALRQGRIGSPRLATHCSYSSLAASTDTRVPPWWFDRARGGGWLGASGSHVVDRFRVWLGDFASVTASLPLVSDRQVDSEDSFVVQFETVSGVVGILQQTAGAWGPAAEVTRIAGTSGTIWPDRGRARICDATGSRDLDVPDDLRLPVAPAESDNPAHRFTHMELGPYTRLAEVFKATIEGADPIEDPAPATFEDGVVCMQVLDAIRESDATHQTVRLDAGKTA
jgi:predicted dehydrogenase